VMTVRERHALAAQAIERIIAHTHGRSHYVDVRRRTGRGMARASSGRAGAGGSPHR
jgi:hypothetical protein